MREVKKKKMNLRMKMVRMSLSNQGGKPAMILVSLHSLIGKAAFHKLDDILSPDQYFKTGSAVFLKRKLPLFDVCIWTDKNVLVK